MTHRARSERKWFNRGISLQEQNSKHSKENHSYWKEKGRKGREGETGNTNKRIGKVSFWRMDHKSFHGYHWERKEICFWGSERFSDIGTEKIEPSVIVWPCPQSSRLSYPTKPLGLGTLLLWVWVHPCAVKVIMLHWEGRNLLPLRGGPLASFGGSMLSLPSKWTLPCSGYKLGPRLRELSVLPLLGPVFARRRRPQHPHETGRSHHITCIASAHVHVCHLLPGVCSRIVNLRHSSSPGSPSCPPVAYSCPLRTPTPEAEHRVPASGWLRDQEARRPGTCPGQPSPKQGDTGSAILSL